MEIEQQRRCVVDQTDGHQDASNEDQERSDEATIRGTRNVEGREDTTDE